MIIEIESTDFFKCVQGTLNEKINFLIGKRLDELKIKLNNVLTKEEVEKLKFEGIDVISFIDNYKFPIYTKLQTHQVKRNREKRVISSEKRCLARIGHGRQCSRSKLEGKEFCKSHSIVLPYGRFDGPLEGKSLIIAGKRGKKNVSSEFELEDLDLSLYIQSIVVKIDGKDYLIDENKMIFTHDYNNDLVGKQIGDEVHWF